MTKIEFTNNYRDFSTEQGFQFEFNCERCNAGYRTSFQPYVIGKISGALDTASSLFGGIFSQASSLGERARSANWEKDHDQAFIKAAEEVKGDFVQCPRCTSWVCREKCWNTSKGLCKRCSPDLGVEMAAAQSSRTVEEIWAHSKMAEDDREMLKEESWREGARATCPECATPLVEKVKFCPECGAKIQQIVFCKECGAKLEPGIKFCSECGTKVGSA